MKHTYPPAWMTAWLETLVPARDHATITGDLLEEYREVVRPSNGIFRSNLWYLGQIASFLFRAEWFPFAARTCAAWALLFTACAFIAPVAGVMAFLIGIPWCGFAVARRSILMWAGTASGLLVSCAMFAIFGILQLSHPPSYWIPILAAAILTILAAFIGRCTGERIQEVVFPRLPIRYLSK